MKRVYLLGNTSIHNIEMCVGLTSLVTQSVSIIVAVILRDTKCPDHVTRDSVTNVGDMSWLAPVTGLISQGKQEGGETWQKINMKWRLTTQSSREPKTEMKVKFVSNCVTPFLSEKHLTLVSATERRQCEKHNQLFARQQQPGRPMLVLFGDWFRSLKDGFCSVMNEGHPTCYYPCTTGSGWNCFQQLVKSIIDK